MKKSSTVGVATVEVAAVLLSACSFTPGRSSATSTSTASPAGVSVTGGSSGSGKRRAPIRWYAWSRSSSRPS
ncbi:MAG: hypothetical protein ACXWEZ_09800 [Actinomycetota bacterium]